MVEFPKSNLDPNTCQCRVEKGEVRDLADSPFPISLEDSRGNPVTARMGRDWTSNPKFKVAKDAKRIAR